MKAMASASSRVLRVLSTAPVIGTPKWASNIDGTLGSITATVSPCATPESCAKLLATTSLTRGGSPVTRTNTDWS